MAIIKKTDILEQGAEKALDPLIAKYEELDKLTAKYVAVSNNLQKTLTGIKKTNDGAEAKKLVSVNTQLIKTNRELTEIEKQREKIQKQSKETVAKLLVAEEKRTKTLLKGKVALQEKNKQQKLDVQINRAQENSIEKLRLTTRKLTAERDKLNIGTKAGIKEFRNLTKQINTNNATLKKLDAQIGKNQRNVGNYKSALKGLGTQLLGAAGIVGAVDLLIKGFTALVERSKQLSKTARVVAQTFDVTRKQAKGLSADILALANNFNEDYNEILKSANAVSKEFGISAEESLALIEEGFKKGSNNSGEFLDILREYPAQLQSVGLSAEESFAIINQQVKAGVYSDKGIDAIKEAGISLRENTKAVKDALRPLSENVRLEIEREVAAGNTFEAMQLIARELKNTNLTAAETQAIMSDVFKGAGEDALTFVENLDELELSLEGVATQTSKVDDANIELSKTWNRFVGDLGGDEGLLSTIWSGFLKAVKEVVKWVDILTDVVSGKWSEASLKYYNINLDVVESEKEKNKELDENNELTKEQIRLREKLAKQYQDNIKWSEAYIKKLEEQRRAEIALMAAEINRRKGIAGEGVEEIAPITGIGVDKDKQIADLNEILKATNDAAEKAALERQKSELEIEAETERLKKVFAQEAFNFADQATDQLVENQLNKQLNALEAREAALKDQLDKGLINEIQYERRLAEIRKQQRQAEARAEKKKALYDIALATAVAVIKALPNFVAAGLVAAQGAVKAAFVAARPIPQFEKGEVDIKGKRHREGGILAEIEGGESVINREGTSNAPMLLDAINKGIIRDADIGMPKAKKDNLMAGLLIQGSRQNKKLDQLITGVGNLGFVLPYGKYFIEKRGDGQIITHNING